MIRAPSSEEKDNKLSPEMEAQLKKEIKKRVKKQLKKQSQTQASESSLDSLYEIGAGFFRSAIFNFYHTAQKDIEHANPENWSHTGTGAIIQAWLRLPCIIAAALIGVSAFIFLPELAGVLSGTIATLTGAPPFVSTTIATCMTALGFPTLTNAVVSTATNLMIHRRFGGPGELMNTEKDRAYFAKQANLDPELIKLIEDASNSIQSLTEDERIDARLYEAMKAIRQGNGIEGLERFADACRDRIKALKREQEKLEETYQEREKGLKGRNTMINAFHVEKQKRLEALSQRIEWIDETLTQVNAKLN